MSLAAEVSHLSIQNCRKYSQILYCHVATALSFRRRTSQRQELIRRLGVWGNCFSPFFLHKEDSSGSPREERRISRLSGGLCCQLGDLRLPAVLPTVNTSAGEINTQRQAARVGDKVMEPESLRWVDSFTTLAAVQMPSLVSSLNETSNRTCM